jgi:hypothetical protein
LVLVYNGQVPADHFPSFRFNGDTGSNYSAVGMQGSTSGATAQTQTETFIYATINGLQSNTRTNIIAQIMDYSATDKNKIVLTRTNGGFNSSGLVFAQAGRWANTAAITSINFFAFNAQSFAAGSTFNLYGIAS